MNHLHQTNFGFEGTLESSNNMLTMMTYGYQSTISGNKKIGSGSDAMLNADFNEAFTIYQFMFALLVNPYISYDSGQWAIFYHSFGGDKFTEYAKCCNENVKYPGSKFGAFGRHVLCATDVFKTAVLDFVELMGNLDNKWAGMRNVTLEEYNKSPYLDNPFHPIDCFYAVGLERDGERFITGMPWKVDPYSTTTFDFNKRMRYYQASNDKFGKFQFHSMNGTEGRWTRKYNGVYEYHAGGNISEIDEYTVDYLDTTTNRITRFYCQNQISRSWYKNFTGYEYEQAGMDCSFGKPSDIYRDAVKNAPTKVGAVNNYIIGYKKDIKSLSVVFGSFIPTYSINVTFGLYTNKGAGLYLSTKPLKGNPDDDKDFLLLDEYKAPENAWNAESKRIDLISGTTYYFAFLFKYCYTEARDIKLQMKKVGDHFTSYRDLDNEWFRIPGTTDQMIKDSQWKPRLIDIPGLEKWRGNNVIYEDNSNWNITKQPPGKLYTSNQNDQGVECTKDCNINKFLFGGDYTSEFRANWWKNTGYAEFPHDFEISFGKSTKFSFVKLTGAGNQGYFSMNSSIQISVANRQEDLEKAESLVYTGRYISNSKDNLIQLGKTVEGSFMLLRVLDNSFTWKNNNAGRTDLSGIDVGSKMIYANRMKMLKGCKWETKQSVGYGLNGMQYIGKKGNSYEAKVDKGDLQFCLIGAKHDSMGSASVYQDGKKVATISKDSMTSTDRHQLKFTSKSYMQVLFASENITKPTTFKVTVDSGEVILNGYMIGEKLTSDGSDSNPNGDGNDSGDVVIPSTNPASKKPNDDSNENLDEGPNGGRGGVSTGAIVGIVIGVIAAIVVVAVVVFVVKVRSGGNDEFQSDAEQLEI